MIQRSMTELVTNVAGRVTLVSEEIGVLLGSTGFSRRDDGETLFELTNLLERTLVPVQPRPEFIDALRTQLLASTASTSLLAASERDLLGQLNTHPFQRRIVGFAALGSLVSAVVVVAIYLVVARSRVADQRSAA